MKKMTKFNMVLQHVVIPPVIVLLTACAAIASSPSLHDAATQGDVARIDECVKKGMPVSAKDKEGNTPLHYAYYYGRKEAVERLAAYGADATIRNKEGDNPQDMQKIAEAEKLLISGAQLIDMNGDWKDSASGREVYRKLQNIEGAIVTRAIVRKVLRAENRLQVLFLAVKLGISGSEKRLNDVVRDCGDKSMAEDYINSGSSALYNGGKEWAERNGYYISTGMGSHRVAWGRF